METQLELFHTYLLEILLQHNTPSLLLKKYLIYFLV